ADWMVAISLQQIVEELHVETHCPPRSLLSSTSLNLLESPVGEHVARRRQTRTFGDVGQISASPFMSTRLRLVTETLGSETPKRAAPIVSSSHQMRDSFG